jgi:hypothetical protein
MIYMRFVRERLKTFFTKCPIRQAQGRLSANQAFYAFVLHAYRNLLF